MTESAAPPDVANRLAVLPLKNSVLFPLQVMPLSIGRQRSVAAIQAALESEDKTLLIVPQKAPAAETPALEDLLTVGTVAVIKRMQRAAEGVHAIVQGVSRAKITSLVSDDPFLQVEVEALPEPQDDGPQIEALHAEVVKLASQAFQLLQPDGQLPLDELLQQVETPIQQVYVLASIFSLGAEREQAVLAADTQQAGLQILHKYLLHEVQVLQIRSQIAQQAQGEMSRQQREYFLRQQLREIQEELGEESPEEAEAAELRRRVEEADLPEHVRQEIDKELTRLQRMSSAAADYQVARTYLDLALELPWKQATEDNLDLTHARQILDEDHFDLDDIKDRIIEHLAVMRMNPQAKAPILCFVGPPGVGKTSVGQSIARAMGRKFERISMGGLHDEAELRGHRRTYVGAMPGRIIQAIRRAGVRNPLLMLDEVDKLGRDFRGDPASALMEILDPAQNFAFHDNYLDLPFDLSKVFFITTANTLDNIPRPLLDRMEVLRLAGYSHEEKLQIARRYLIRRRLAEAGLTEQQLSIPDEPLLHIIRRYTREAGVRELERTIGRLARKIATRFAMGQTAPVDLSIADLAELLGPEHFTPEQARKTLRPGIAAGLAWTEVGGEVLYVEAVLIPDSSQLTLTGQLGDVMKESALAARSFIRAQASSLGLDAARIGGSGAHIHVPAGAVPKDGPSAGVTMVTALASLYAGLPCRSDTTMTGEITLSGLVLPVGGVKEKLLAAHRAGLQRIILPRDNEKDLAELPEHVRAALDITLVGQIEEALGAAIPGLEISAARSSTESN